MTTMEEKRRLAIKYDNSAFLDLQVWSDYTKVDHAVDALYEELKTIPGFKGNTRIRKRQLKVVILDLYMKWLTDPTMYTAYHRGKTRYSEIVSRYNLNDVTWVLVSVVDAMIHKGYIENKMGYDWEGKSRVSRMKSRKKLTRLLVDKYNFRPYMLGKRRDTECIILRDVDSESDKQLGIPYDDTPYIIRMRQSLRAYNNLLYRTFIDIPHFPKEGVRSKSAMRKIKINRNDKFVRRIFNNGRWDEGGRFYGGWWQRLPKEWRRHIRINLEPVVEIDYSGLHIIILYTLEGIDYWKEVGKDPYQISGYEKSERMRRLLKLVLLAAINAANKKKTVGAVQHEINFDKDEFGWHAESGIDLDELVDKFAEEHKPIRKYFFTGHGIKLQHLDSTMAEYVINDMAKYPFPVLCIHDSFITDIGTEELLRPLIFKAFEYALVKSGKPLKEALVKASRAGMLLEDYDYFMEHGYLWADGSWKSLPGELDTIKRDHEYLERFKDHTKRPWEKDYYR